MDDRPSRPQDLAPARLGLPEEARLQLAGAPPAARQGGERRGAAGVQKGLAIRVDERRAENPQRSVEVWAFDEHRVGLKPILRRQWAPKGQRPIAVGQHRYEWLYLYGFVHPSTGAVIWFVCSTVDTDLLSAVLAAFARAVGAGQDKLVVLVLDQAGWHVSEKLVVPDGIVLEFLPSYTPELQPAERLWPLTNEAVANQHFATLKALDTALSARCCTLAAMPEIIKAETHFGWWPAIAVAN
ncbi:MAG TPA: IS630 family transposase [Geminicoccaceae bacterium]|nr:IS630 family transposase [Geminicoccaceae bacterium]